MRPYLQTRSLHEEPCVLRVDRYVEVTVCESVFVDIGANTRVFVSIPCNPDTINAAAHYIVVIHNELPDGDLV